jgi:hypothetical protein
MREMKQRLKKIIRLKMKISEEKKQGCQMVSFQTKNPHSGIFWRTLEWKMLCQEKFGNPGTQWFTNFVFLSICTFIMENRSKYKNT